MRMVRILKVLCIELQVLDSRTIEPFLPFPEPSMTGPIKDFSITDANGKQCFFYTEKTPSGTPRAGTFLNDAGHINKGYFWHMRTGSSADTEELLPPICLSLNASRAQIQAAFFKSNR